MAQLGVRELLEMELHYGTSVVLSIAAIIVTNQK